MFKKILPLLLIIGFILTGGLGCKGLSQEEQAAIKPITLKYWTVYNDTDKLKEYAAEYQQMRPYVKIDIRQVRSSDFDDRFITALADDVAPDIVSMHVRDLGKHASRLATMPRSVQVSKVYVKGEYAKETVVEPVIQSMPSANDIAKAYVSTVIDDVVRNGNIYGLPMSFDTLAVYYNIDLLDKSGVPEPPTNWNEFMEAVKKSTRYNASGDIIQSGVALGTADNIGNFFDVLSVLMIQSGVRMAQGNTVTFASGVDENTANHPTIQALRFYTDFARPTKDVYTWNAKMDDAFTAFTRSRSVFYLGFAYEANTIQARAPQMNLGIIPLPQLREKNPINIANYWIESVVKKSKNPNEAWDFVRFITSQEKVKDYVAKTGQLSPLRVHIVEQQADLDLAPFVDNVLSSENWYHGNNYDAVKNALGNMTEDYLQPYGSDQKPEERDKAIVQRASQIIQQTY